MKGSKINKLSLRELQFNPISVSSIVLWCHRPMDKFHVGSISRDITKLFQMRFNLMVISLESENHIYTKDECCYTSQISGWSNNP